MPHTITKQHRLNDVFKKVKTAPVCQGPFLKIRLPLMLTRNRVQRAVFRLNQQFAVSNNRIGQEA